jgi:hypothetical protein
MISPREWILPVALSLASILLTSLVLAEVHSHLTAFHVWSDPEDLALAYLLPTIFIAVFFGSTIAATSSFASGLAAAYFIYPPKFSVLIDDPQHVAELGFIIVLAITASKAVAVITDDKPLTRRFRGEGPVAPLRVARERPVTERSLLETSHVHHTARVSACSTAPAAHGVEGREGKREILDYYSK